VQNDLTPDERRILLTMGEFIIEKKGVKPQSVEETILLVEGSGCSVSEIADRCKWVKSRVYSTMLSLEKKGYLSTMDGDDAGLLGSTGAAWFGNAFQARRLENTF